MSYIGMIFKLSVKIEKNWNHLPFILGTLQWMWCFYAFINFVQWAKMGYFRRETVRKRGLWTEDPFQMPKWNIYILEIENLLKGYIKQ